jgi:nickel transport protein
MKPALRTLLGAAILCLAHTAPAEAHGSHIEASVDRTVTVTRTVDISATTHGSRPMAEARVTVYAPGAPDEPWLSGTCDSDGRFRFDLPGEAAGTWDIRVAHQGHGGQIRLDIPAEDDDSRDTVTAEAIAAQPPLSTLQKAILGGSVVWGCVGTAFFFARRRR